ncbi:chaperonin 10-like protein [Lipomyces tetrasporus]|uniref:Chaperonin 10-like protein n=1 Tax=Lipomyces tetrasporus TaxID=54092 RepID=A0AAD7VPZ0_9ASCO|nr:chaperonin 10-like protein [Lipomyces tetrasporus]KAJ8097688.1 chaperonin 10-like protein [Lipomyces tetrasporus]
MKALRVARASPSSPPTLSLETVPKPTVTPGHVLVKVHASAVHPSDRFNTKGFFPLTTYPRIPGRDYSGTIVDGPKHMIGQVVFGTSGSLLGFTADGVHAEYCLVPEDAVAPKPSNLSTLQAATVGVPFTTALLCLRRARATAEDVVLVLGATGAVGSAVVQVAKALGCKRVITASRRDSTDVNVVKDAALETVGSLTADKGADVVIDTVGDLSLMKAALGVLAVKGRYTWIAAPKGGVSTDFTFDVFQAYRKEHELVGCNSLNYTIADMADMMRELQKWFESGKMTAKAEDELAVVGLDEAVDAYGRDPAGKLLVISTDK